jgi:sugar O-acyltransferase (sialic acid O-acetyltransferase NeuD family)
MEDIQYNKKETVILGAGGLGRELASWIVLDEKFSKNHKFEGFLDDNLNALDNFETDLKVRGKITIDVLNNYKNVLVAIADSTYKKQIMEEVIANSNIELLSFKFKNVLVGLHTNLGKGVVLLPSVIVSCNVNIGNGVFINCGSQIGHDVQIGNYVSIMANVDIGGGAIIEDEVFIGSGAVILPGVIIPKGTRIGAGSVVLRSIKKVGTYFGNPAMKIL